MELMLKLLTGGAGSLAAIAGYPHLTVPMGGVEGLPVGISIMGGQWQDHAVLKAGAAYEKARTAKLPAPKLSPIQTQRPTTSYNKSPIKCSSCLRPIAACARATPRASTKSLTT